MEKRPLHPISKKCWLTVFIYPSLLTCSAVSAIYIDNFGWVWLLLCLPFQSKEGGSHPWAKKYDTWVLLTQKPALFRHDTKQWFILTMVASTPRISHNSPFWLVHGFWISRWCCPLFVQLSAHSFHTHTHTNLFYFKPVKTWYFFSRTLSALAVSYVYIGGQTAITDPS